MVKTRNNYIDTGFITKGKIKVLVTEQLIINAELAL